MSRYSNRYASDFHDESEWRIPNKQRTSNHLSEFNETRQKNKHFETLLLDLLNQADIFDGYLTKGYGDYLNGCGMWKEVSDKFYISHVDYIRGYPVRATKLEGGWTVDELIKQFDISDELINELHTHFYGDYHEVYKKIVWIWNRDGVLRAYHIGSDWVIEPEAGWTIQVWTREVPNYLNFEMKVGIDESIDFD